jgi:Cu2+-exporting ATPase/Cu+-exporting ATPase
MKLSFDITGMGCAACVNRIETDVGKLTGVADVNVNLLKNSMEVEFDENSLTIGAIEDAVTAAGYGAKVVITERVSDKKKQITPRETPAERAKKETKAHKNRFIISAVFAVPLFILAMLPMWVPPLRFLHSERYSGVLVLTELLLLMPIIFVNITLLKNGLLKLFKLRPDMDSLIALGAAVSIVYGLFTCYVMMINFGKGMPDANVNLLHNLYFDSAAMILTFISLGRFLESKAKSKTTAGVESLLKLAPKSARVVKSETEAEVVDAELVERGEILLVKAGETIPADGKIIDGEGTVNEAMLTGESLPVDKKTGDSVVGATLLMTGAIKFEVTAAGDNTAFAKIIKLVDDATSSKAPVQRLADKIAGIFVPVVIAIAIITAVIWVIAGKDIPFAVSAAVGVLVISCPCALGLATPTAVMVGTGVGLRQGIFIKSASVLETARLVNTIVLDKTGTVTEGKPKAVAMYSGVGRDITPGREIAGELTEELLSVACALEQQSSHPIAAAVVDAAHKVNIFVESVENYRFVEGRGVVGDIGEKECYGGNRKLMKDAGVDITDCIEAELHVQQRGEIPIYFARGKQLLGMISFADEIRETSAAAVKVFRKNHMTVTMLTGDNEKTALAIAAKAGIDNVIAGVLPDGKEGEIRKLQSEKRVVMMVGDGINDAPALVSADCGVAIGQGADVALDCADIILTRSDLRDVSKAISLSKKVYRNIKQNLFWAVIYNLIGIPLAAGALYPLTGMTIDPMFCALAMSLSSLTVVINALRLGKLKL